MMDKALLERILMLNNLILVLVLFGSADAQDGCAPEVRVRKNTVYKIFSKTCFNISCPVRYCEKIPMITWFKLSASNTNDYIPVTDQITITQERSTAHEKIITSYLIFKSISNNDTGMYKCAASQSDFISESHNINVSVSDTFLPTDNKNITPSSGSKPGEVGVGWMPYIIICSGIIGLVTVVLVIFFLSVDGCKCSRKDKNHRTQVPPSPNVSKSDGHCRGKEKSERKNVYKSSAETLQLDIPSISSARDQQENTPQQQIVYATLDHLAPRVPPAVHHFSREQHSEYAAIRYTETV
ncbi:B- and T-lymphocyte attenuator [Astyanax mexicanus]|uniref:B- and T-lymphocyte attenuator n=1 Tax=Astyanax mexicanus TaxID=7994 RepID=A0A8B9L1L9_ASTMX|nr:B- and T-lymphocyte attenuator [Astyanax mexicanus]